MEITTEKSFRVNSAAVTHEIIDGEAVIINLVTGNYYTLDKAGADVWRLVENGASVASIVKQISQLYDGGQFSKLIESSSKLCGTAPLFGSKEEYGSCPLE